MTGVTHSLSVAELAEIVKNVIHIPTNSATRPFGLNSPASAGLLKSLLSLEPFQLILKSFQPVFELLDLCRVVG